MFYWESRQIGSESLPQCLATSFHACFLSAKVIHSTVTGLPPGLAGSRGPPGSGAPKRGDPCWVISS